MTTRAKTGKGRAGQMNITAMNQNESVGSEPGQSDMVRAWPCKCASKMNKVDSFRLGACLGAALPGPRPINSMMCGTVAILIMAQLSRDGIVWNHRARARRGE